MEPAEQLFWTGQPRQRLGIAEWFAVVGAFGGLLSRQGWLEWTLAGGAVLALIVGFIWRANTFYGITDRRIIVVTSGQAQTHAISDIESVEVSKGTGDSGSLFFVIMDRGKRVKRGFYFVNQVDSVHELVESLRQVEPDAVHA